MKKQDKRGAKRNYAVAGLVVGVVVIGCAFPWIAEIMDW